MLRDTVSGRLSKMSAKSGASGSSTPVTRPNTRNKEKESTERDRKETSEKDKKESADSRSTSTVSESPKIDLASEFVKLKKELKMLVENEATITEKLVAIEHGFASKIDEVKNEIKIEMKTIRDEIKNEMKVELDHVKDDIITVNAKLSSVEESLNFQEGQTKEKLKKLKEDQEASMKEQETRINKANADLDKKLKELDVKLQLLEKKDRKYNLLFYGFHEEAGEMFSE